MRKRITGFTLNLESLQNSTSWILAYNHESSKHVSSQCMLVKKVCNYVCADLTLIPLCHLQYVIDSNAWDILSHAVISSTKVEIWKPLSDCNWSVHISFIDAALHTLEIVCWASPFMSCLSWSNPYYPLWQVDQEILRLLDCLDSPAPLPLPDNPLGVHVWCSRVFTNYEFHSSKLGIFCLDKYNEYSSVYNSVFLTC